MENPPAALFSIVPRRNWLDGDGRTDGLTEPPPFLLHMISFWGEVGVGEQNCHSSSANIRHPSEKVTYSVRVRMDFARCWALPAMAPLLRLTGRFLRTVSHTELRLQNNSGWEAELTPANWLAEWGRAVNSQHRPRIWHFQNSSCLGVFLPPAVSCATLSGIPTLQT